MADEKISDLTATLSIADADLLTTVQGGVNKKISGSTLKTVIGWERSGTDVTPKVAADNINIGTGGLKDNDVSTPVALGDASNTTFDTTNQTIIGSVNEVNSNIPSAVEDVLTISFNGETSFTLSSTPIGSAAFSLFLNGQLRLRGTDYTQSGTGLTWLDPGSLTLLTTDELIARYNDTSVGPAGVAVWSDDGTDVTPINAGRNVDIGTGILKDNDATTGIPLGDAINTSLDASFTATSLLGAINENKTSETIISKSFGDSPYAAVAGDNAISVDTSGGAVTVTLPAAASNSGVRIRVSKVTTDINQVIVATTGGDTVGFQAQWALSNQGDSVTAISNGVTEWCLFTERHASASIYFSIEPDGNLGDHRVQNISGSSGHRFEFQMPSDFLSITRLVLIASPSAGAAGSGKDIDLFSDYATIGELFNAHSESDTTTTYDFTGDTDKLIEMDISGVFSSVTALDMCGVFVDHNAIGGTLRYFGIQLDYLRKG